MIHYKQSLVRYFTKRRRLLLGRDFLEKGGTNIMVTWNNLDTLASFKKLAGMKDRVNIAQEMSGENGAARVKKYSAPMAAGMKFNYAAKQVDDEILSTLAQLAQEAQVIDKYKELLNGAMINTGENRLVLHQLARGQQRSEGAHV